MESDAPGERLRCLPQQVGRCTPENQKPTPNARLIHQNTQGCKDLGPALHFVQNNEPSQRFECEMWILKLEEILRTLEVEHRRGTAMPGDELPRESGLAHLARTQDGDDRKWPQQLFESVQVLGSRDHGSTLP
jgi:hypothetical protein